MVWPFSVITDPIRRSQMVLFVGVCNQRMLIISDREESQLGYVYQEAVRSGGKSNHINRTLIHFRPSREMSVNSKILLLQSNCLTFLEKNCESLKGPIPSIFYN